MPHRQVGSFDSFYNEMRAENLGNNLTTPSQTDKQNRRGVNIIRDTIALCLTVSEISGTPMLFLSNPGEGKTTGVEVFGNINGRHVESLMGSQYTQDDILGFMVNTGKEYLETKIPEWYHRIMEYTKWHWEIKGDKNFELGNTERRKLIERKKLFIRYQKNEIDEMELLDLDIPFDKMDISKEIENIDKELDERFIWVGPRKTILFLDELSAVHPNVQASLLRLCHSKTLKDNNKLPSDCIVCAAGNFKNNLPSYFDIIAPELNRFCIINLIRGLSTDTPATLSKELVDEFTQDYQEVYYDFPKYERFYFSDSMKKAFLNACREKLFMLCDQFGFLDLPSGYLDVRNTNFNNIFEGVSYDNPEVANFVSGRVISKYINVLKALCELRVEPDYLRGVYSKFAIGLLGLGTNSWDDDKKDRRDQIKHYQKELGNMTKEILKEFNHPEKETFVVAQDNFLKLETFDEGSIYGKVHELAGIQKPDDVEKKIDNILEQISKEFPSETSLVIPNLISTLQDKEIDKVIAWRADYESIILLSDIINKYYIDAKADVYSSALKRVVSIYEFYYNCLVVDSVSMEDIVNAE